jgi:hypothetical protein
MDVHAGVRNCVAHLLDRRRMSGLRSCLAAHTVPRVFEDLAASGLVSLSRQSRRAADRRGRGSRRVCLNAGLNVVYPSTRAARRPSALSLAEHVTCIAVCNRSDRTGRSGTDRAGSAYIPFRRRRSARISRLPDTTRCSLGLPCRFPAVFHFPDRDTQEPGYPRTPRPGRVVTCGSHRMVRNLHT